MTAPRREALMILLALLVIPVMIVEQQSTDPTVLLVAWVLNLLIWLAFVADYLLGIRSAPDRRRFARERWFDLAIILLSVPLYLPEPMAGVRSLRALRVLQMGRMGRLLRLLRLVRVLAFLARAWQSARRVMGGHSFGYLLFSSALFVVGGGALFVLVEGRELTLLDGIWWAVATLTTVGYGDIYPQTVAGRLIALLIILMGLGLVATLTANVAAFFVESDQQKGDSPVLERLDAIAARLDRLEERLGALERLAGPQGGAAAGAQKGGGAPPPSGG
ncbi:MAG: potassium channel family protein [Bacillota bacterium]